MRKNAILFLFAAITFGIAQCTNNSKQGQKTNEGEKLASKADAIQNESEPALFSKWDTNKDKQLTEQEFRTGMQAKNYWNDWNWDLDANDEVDEEEWRMELYSIGDVDEDGSWGQEEWLAFENEYQTGWEWEDIDSDGNKVLTQEEWAVSWDHQDFFEIWDQNDDNVLSASEYYAYNFEVYDDDNDGIWNETEYMEYEEDWGLS